MTKNRRRKQDARERMAATGTRYAQAHREDAQERTSLPSVKNPLLQAWALAMQAGELTLDQLLEGWTLDGAVVSPRVKGETYLEITMLNFVAHAAPEVMEKLYLPADWEKRLLSTWLAGEATGFLRYRFSPTPVTLALLYDPTPLGGEALRFATRVTPEHFPLVMDLPASHSVPQQSFEEELDQAVHMGLVLPDMAAAIRLTRRMARTAQQRGEDFHTSVIELGEEGDKWFIAGAKGLGEAQLLLYSWLAETDRKLDLEGGWGDFETIAFIERRDWFWKPLVKIDPEGDAELLSLASAPERYEGESLVSGFFAQEG
jgi:hypothetical protein